MFNRNLLRIVFCMQLVMIAYKYKLNNITLLPYLPNITPIKATHLWCKVCLPFIIFVFILLNK